MVNGLPSNARVATVHISIFPLLRKRLHSGGTSQLIKTIIQSRQQLINRGFSHVALTGPMVANLHIDKRLIEIERHTNSPYLTFPAILNAQISFYTAWVLFHIYRKSPTERQRLLKAARSSRAGFRDYVVYKL